MNSSVFWKYASLWTDFASAQQNWWGRKPKQKPNRNRTRIREEKHEELERTRTRTRTWSPGVACNGLRGSCYEVITISVSLSLFSSTVTSIELLLSSLGWRLSTCSLLKFPVFFLRLFLSTSSSKDLFSHHRRSTLLYFMMRQTSASTTWTWGSTSHPPFDLFYASSSW